jgi:TonB-linked SusC/RagA family outer membrane protein
MRKFLTLLAVLVLYSVLASAQTKVVSGRITDSKGQPIPFSTVRIKGTKAGTSADADGNFTLHANIGDVLIISGTGITSKNVEVTDVPLIHIEVERNVPALTEVVVTALGQTQSKAKLGYATQTFNTSTINRDGASGMLDGLVGKIAGAEISSTGGPGSSTKVVLRGYGVISGGNNQPLYVVDGVPMSDGIFQGSTNGTDGSDYGNGMTNINPNDIESLNILEGTAASSIYGGLAKNGVIVITTKKGRAGKLKIEYSGSANFSKVGKLPDYQSEFGDGWGGQFNNDENGSWGPRLDGKMRLWGSIVDNSQLIKPFSAIKDPLRQFYVTGSEYNNSLGLSGGTATTRFYFSYSNLNSNSVIPDNGNTQLRNTFSLRTNSTFDKFTFNTSLNYVGQTLKVPNTGQNTSSGGGVFQSLLQIPADIPIHDFRDINNKFFNTNNFFTPYAENPYFGLLENGNQQKLDRIFGNLDFGYAFTTKLSAELRIGADITNAKTFEWKNSAYAQPGSWDGPSPTNSEGFSRTPDFGGVAQGSDYYGLINSDLIVKYNTDLGSSFTINALGGANLYTTDQRSERTAVTNIVVPGFYNLSNTSKPPTTTDNSFLRRRVGLYGQVIFGFKDQLYLTGNIRNDWSSTLPVNANSIFYPGANLSWIASQWLGSGHTLSYLKLRAAYGRTGSDPGPYQTQSSLGTGNIPLPFGSLTVPFNGVSGFGINNTINSPTLKPIFTDEKEAGAEFRFFRDQIGLDVSLYDKRTKGQIFPVPIAPSTGYDFLVQNLGTVQNKGIEINLNVKPFVNNGNGFNWNFQYNFTKNWNKVLSLTGASQDPLLFGFTSAIDAELRAVVGKTVASIYDGVPQKSPTGQVVVNAVTGYPIPNATPLDQNGLVKGYYGSALNDYVMGFSNTFTYKDFSLSFTLDYRMGGVMYSQTATLSMFVGNSIITTYNDRRPFIFPNSVVAKTVGGHTTYSPNTTYIGNGAPYNSETDQYYNAYSESNSFSAAADAYTIIDRSFLKLRDITLGYDLPKTWAPRIGASSASLAFYARNFLLWTPKSNVFTDPESSNLGNDLQGEYGELNAAPLNHSYGVILRVVF